MLLTIWSCFKSIFIVYGYILILSDYLRKKIVRSVTPILRISEKPKINNIVTIIFIIYIYLKVFGTYCFFSGKSTPYNSIFQKTRKNHEKK